MTDRLSSIKKRIAVAVAILRYTDKAGAVHYLMARRHAHQHEGGKLEFIGGKIEKDETPSEALCREVAEEIGLVLDKAVLTRLGIIHHDYIDKSVVLHIYQLRLTDGDYSAYHERTLGEQGQALSWHSLADLWRCQAELPAANLMILNWLSLPTTIAITEALADFSSQAEFISQYADSPHACLYIRPETDATTAADIVDVFVSHDKQRQLMMSLATYQAWRTQPKDNDIANISIKLNADELKHFSSHPDALHAIILDVLPLYVGVHDRAEAQLANQLHAYYPLTAAFVSPVFSTATHPDAKPLHLTGLAWLASRLEMPVVALGGMAPDDLNRVKAHGAAAVAGIRGFG